MNATVIDLPQRTHRREQELVSAFAAIRDELVSTLYFVLGNRDDAQDAAQAAFLKCWQARAGLADVRDVRAWLFRAALNAAKDLARSAWRRKRRPLDNLLHERAGAGASPVELLIGREEAAWLGVAVSRLRPGERDVFWLRLSEQLSYREIAALWGIPIGTVKTHMRLALRKLQRQFQSATAQGRNSSHAGLPPSALGAGNG